MLDRFKFRFFDSVSKEMYYPTEYNGKAEYIERRYDLSGMFRFKDFIPSQCLGITDKNGKLIYEGDIVAIGGDMEELAVIKWDEDEARYIVDEINEGVCSSFSNWYGYELEVVGNIHENGELVQKGETNVR